MRRALLIALAGVLAVACGGGGIALGPSDGGVGSGGTGAVASVVASGPIEGFGSIIVNGTRYEIDAARAELRDTTQLKLGMTVQITGTVSPDLRTGTASVVTSTTQAKGPLTGLDRAARSFTVLGLRVTVDETTVFADAGALDALSDGTPVQVWGIARAGALLATRVERQPTQTPASSATASEQVITDTARELDPGGRSFKVGSLVVSYPSAIPAEVSEALTSGAPVRVRGTLNAAGTGLVASSVEPAEPSVPAEQAVLSLSGNVTGWTGSRFVLDGYTVDATTAQVTGGRNRLDEGARVDVVGPVQGKVLAATRIRVRQPAVAAPPALASPSLGASAPAAAPVPAPAASAPAAPAPTPTAPTAPPPPPAPPAPASSAPTTELPASPASAAPAPSTTPPAPATAPAETAPPPVLAAGTFSATGTITAFASDASFQVQRQGIDASGPATEFVKGTRRELAAGRTVQVTGTRVRGDVLIAERVEFTDR